MKICPNCGSKNIDLITPIDSTLWQCKTCNYIGTAIDGNDESIKEIRYNYIEKLKEIKDNKETEKVLNKKREIEFPENLEDTIQIPDKKIKKICPRCGSDNIDWFLPQNWSIWDCKTCGYRGPVIEGDENLIQEIRNDYHEKLKDENRWIKDNYENGLYEDILTDEKFERIVKELNEYDFHSDSPHHEPVSSEKDLIDGIDSNIVEIYKKIKKEILDWNNEIKFKPMNGYLTFSKYSRFLQLSLDKDKINFQLSFRKHLPFEDYKKITKESKTEKDDDDLLKLDFSINNDYEIEYALFLIKQSCKNNQKDSFLENLLLKIFPQSKYY
ncbi:MAG: DUF5655 domain-containing protein [Methanobrevibacter sp.]|nr:DUF5655 domain-containing protein [Methanobrevibacter sp.]